MNRLLATVVHIATVLLITIGAGLLLDLFPVELVAWRADCQPHCYFRLVESDGFDSLHLIGTGFLLLGIALQMVWRATRRRHDR